jgi:hypothetical protein
MGCSGCVCVLIMNVLCCWFRTFKESGGGVLLSGVEFVQCSEYEVTCIVHMYVNSVVLVRGHVVSATTPSDRNFDFLDPEPLLFLPCVSSQKL